MAEPRQTRAWWGWCAVAAATVALCWPLLTRPTLPRASDVSYHAQWARGFIDALRDGAAYPRWVSDTNRGFGAPIFVVYPPLPYYAVAAASLVSPNVVEALRWTLIAASFLSGIAFLLAARDFAGEAAAAAGAALYVLLPYHAVDLYDRFALAELLAFVWFPLLFLAVRRLARRPSPAAWLTLVVAYAGLVLTHLMSAYLVLFVLAPYALRQLRRTQRWPRLAPMAAAGAVALLCCGVYLVPFVVQRDRIHLDWFDEPHYNWRRNFIYRDETAFGFKPDITKPWANRAATTQAAVAAAAALLLALRARDAAGSAGRRAEPVPHAATAGEGWTHLGLAAWALFLQTPLSTPIWAVVPQLAAAQFPWRFSALQLLCTAFACACALSRDGGTGAGTARGAPDAAPRDTSGGPGRRRHRARAATAAAETAGAGAFLRRPAAAAALVAVASLPALFVTARVVNARDWTFDEAMARSPLYRYRVVKEFFPRGVAGWKDWDAVPFPQPGQDANLAGPGRVEVLAWSGQRRRIRVDAAGDTRLRVRTFDYPGWQARLDGQPVPIRSGEPNRVIEVDVPAGSHTVELIFAATWDQRLGLGASAVGLALALAGAAAFARSAGATRQKVGDGKEAVAPA